LHSCMLRPTRTTTIIAAMLTGVLATTSAAHATDDDEEPGVTPVDVPVVSPVVSPFASPVVSPVVSPITTPDVAPEPEMETHWYGWQVLAADAAGIIGTIGCTTAADSAVCVVPFMIAAPTVHLSHGRPLQALASLGLRVALPIAGAIIGAQAANCTEGEWLCGVGEAALGVLIGTVTASMVDAFSLSTEVRERPTATPSRLSFLAPSVSAGPNGASFGLRGSF